MGEVPKRLVVVRHAKSSWDDPTVADHDRPLAPRGIKALRRLRDHLEGSTPTADLVLCSSSQRTRETLDGIRPVLGDDAVIEIEPALYGASASELVARLRRIDEPVTSVILIGHNPGAAELVELLAGPGAWEQWHLDKFPTAAVATFSLPGRWADLQSGSGVLEGVWTPRRAPS